MTDKKSAIVIGGGLVGCCTAYYLNQFGWNVRILERNTMGSGASHGNCGYICPSHALPLAGPGVIGKTLPSLLKRDAPLAIPPRVDPALWKWLVRFSRRCNEADVQRSSVGRDALLKSSMLLYRALVQQESIACQWQDQGLLLVFRSSQEWSHYKKVADRLARNFGIQTISFEGEAVREFEPSLRSGMAGGWHFPEDAHVRPDSLVAGIRDVLTRSGIQIHERNEASELLRIGNRVIGVKTSSASFEADAVVITAGAESSLLADRFGFSLPIQPGKGYSITYGSMVRGPRVPMIFEDHHVAVTPFEDGFRVGSTMEFTGFDRRLNPKRLRLLKRSAEEHLTEALPESIAEEWAGWRPMTYDGLPCIGPVDRQPNLFVAAGNGMIGLASAPATGKLLGELVDGRTPHLDPHPYRVDRF